MWFHTDTGYMGSELRVTQINILFSLGFLKYCKHLEDPIVTSKHSEMFKGMRLGTHCLGNVHRNCEGL